jgi:hypothetical protein
LGGLEVSIALPQGKAALRVASLFDGKDLPFTQGGGRVRFALGNLEVWEAVAVYLQ